MNLLAHGPGSPAAWGLDQKPLGDLTAHECRKNIRELTSSCLSRAWLSFLCLTRWQFLIFSAFRWIFVYVRACIHTFLVYAYIDTYIYGVWRGEEVGGSGRNQHISSIITSSYMNDLGTHKHGMLE